MAGDRNVPRRIRKNHLGPLVSEKPGVALAHQGICAKDAMLAEQPEISQLRHRRRGLVQRRQIILFVVAGAFEGDVDLGSNPGAPGNRGSGGDAIQRRESCSRWRRSALISARNRKPKLSGSGASDSPAQERGASRRKPSPLKEGRRVALPRRCHDGVTRSRVQHGLAAAS